MLTKQGNGLLNESCSAVFEKDTMKNNIQHMFSELFLNKLKWERGEIIEGHKSNKADVKWQRYLCIKCHKEVSNFCLCQK